MSLANSPWLSDWRRYADETLMSPRDRRMVEGIIGKASTEWAGRHEKWYRDRFNSNRGRRNDEVIGACDAAIEELDDLIEDLRGGRITAAQASSRWRSIDGVLPNIVSLHNTLVEEDDVLAQDAEMTPEDYQRFYIGRNPILTTLGEPTLAGLVEQATPPLWAAGYDPSAPRVDTGDAPSADDLPDHVGRR